MVTILFTVCGYNTVRHDQTKKGEEEKSSGCRYRRQFSFAAGRISLCFFALVGPSVVGDNTAETERKKKE